jgi:hypothetical protein
MHLPSSKLFCDHASRFIHISCNHSTGADEALNAKRTFEQAASLANVSISKYRADNGIFTASKWKDSCTILGQTTDFCGVNAHNQNGIAEWQIRTIIDRARTMLLHAMQHWSDVIKVVFWPYALKLAADIHNVTPGPSG